MAAGKYWLLHKVTNQVHQGLVDDRAQWFCRRLRGPEVVIYSGFDGFFNSAVDGETAPQNMK